MSRLDEIAERAKSRLDAVNARLSERMSALDARLGGGGTAEKNAAKSARRGTAESAPRAGGGKNRRVALCVGLKDVSPAAYFPDRPPSLPGCPIDADRFACALEKLGFDSVLTLKDAEATCARVYGAVLRAAGSLDAGDLFVMLVSGHGGADSWCLYDGAVDNGTTRWMLSRFRRGVRILLVNDQCHSGALFPPSGEGGGAVIDGVCGKDGYAAGWDADAAWNSPDFPMVMQFAACRAEQTSTDGIAGGWWAQTLMTVLEQAQMMNRTPTYSEWFDAACDILVQSQLQNRQGASPQMPQRSESPGVTDEFRNAVALT